MKTATITIHTDGTIEAVNFDLRLLGATHVKRRRLSHIWPENTLKRIAFRFIRACASDNGRIAAWTRKWVGPWQVRLVNEPRTICYRHNLREVCVEWEQEHVI